MKYLQRKHIKVFYPLFGMLAKEIWMYSKIERSESIDGIGAWQSSWLKNALQQYLVQTQPNKVVKCLCMMLPIKWQTDTITLKCDRME